MKRLFLIVFFTITLSLQKAEAQLAPVGTKWNYNRVDYNGFSYYYFNNSIVIQKDTVIDSTVFSCIGSSYWTNENNKIYYHYNLKKRLFFDFNAKQMDTIYVDLLFNLHFFNYSVDSSISRYPVRIDSIYYFHWSSNDSVLSFNFSGLKNIDTSHYSTRLQNTINPKIIFGPKYSDMAIFKPYLFQDPPFESQITFRCYQEPNGFKVKSSFSINCDAIGVSEINNLEKSISIFPNPSSGEFTLEVNGNLKLKKITVYDILGDLVKSENVSDGKNFKVSLKEKASGNYFVVVELEPARTERGGNEVRVVKRIIIE